MGKSGDVNYSNHAYTFYYRQLDTYGKKIYDLIEANLENIKSGTYTLVLGDEISNVLYTENGEEKLKEAFQSAWNMIMIDRPDIFYIDVSKIYLNIQTTTLGQQVKYYVYMSPKEGTTYFSEGFSSKTQVNQYLEQTEALKKQIFTLIKDLPKEEQVLKIHDLLITNLEYDETLERLNNNNIYGALIQKNVVCEGYAKAFKYLVDSLEIPCILVYGYGTDKQGNQESHSWNYVQIENKWYAVDVTWDDPIIRSNTSISLPDEEKYRYFLKGADSFFKDHKENVKIAEKGQELAYPTLSKQDYNH